MREVIDMINKRIPLKLTLLIFATICMVLIQYILVPGSVTLGQFMIVSRQASALGIIALGQAIVILVGGIDLSVGSIVMTTNLFCIASMRGSNDYLLYGLGLCFLIAVLVGFFNSVGILYLGIAPFVMTLCTMTILQGICYVYTQGAPTGSAAPMIRSLGTGYFCKIPYSTIIWVVLAFVSIIILKLTTLGRKIYAVGGNSRAAELSGINSKAIITFAYVFSAILSMISGVILSGYLNISSLTVGGDYVNNSLAAVLIGGNAISGGKGGIIGVVFGAFLMTYLLAILTMLGIGEVGKLIVQGIVIFTVVALQGIRQKS
jgi:ribose/xylose/arabinose/galactoside ABC-type transport system permease subunit